MFIKRQEHVQQLHGQWYTLAPEVSAIGLTFACLPSSICTEMLAFDKSTPELFSACVSVSSNLSKNNLASSVNGNQMLWEANITICKPHSDHNNIHFATIYGKNNWPGF